MFKQKHLSRTEVHLDTMRGLAALVVVAGHARSLFFSNIVGTTSETGLTMGHEAVMVFFVLSGYLVGGSVLRMFAANSWSWTDYLIKRLVRLWIVLIPAVFIGLFIDNVGGRFFDQTGSIYSAPAGQDLVTSDSLRQSVYVVLGNVFFLQNFLVPTVGTNTALWSLANEFWYYLAFPLIMVTFQPNVSTAYRLTCALAAVGIFVLIGVHAVYLFLIWTLGAMISCMRPRISQDIAGTVVMVVAVTFVAVSIIVKKSDMPLFPAETIMAISTAVLIYAVRCNNDTTRQSIYTMAAKFLSSISYSLYLTHLPFLVLLCAIFNSPWAKWSMSPLAAMEFLAISAATIVWATLVYLMFESNTDVARRAVSALVVKLTRASVREAG